MACLWDVCGHFSRDTAVQAALNKLLSALGEAAKYQADLVDKASRAVKRNLQTFVKTLVCIYLVPVICDELFHKFIHRRERSACMQLLQLHVQVQGIHGARYSPP